MKLGCYFFCGGYLPQGEYALKFIAFYPYQDGRLGGNILVYVTILYVTILKNPYKTKTNEARMLIFSVGGIYHKRSMPCKFYNSTPIRMGARVKLPYPPPQRNLTVCHYFHFVLLNSILPYKTKTNKAKMIIITVKPLFYSTGAIWGEIIPAPP